MRDLLSAAGRAFLRAFGSSILILAPGVFAAADLNRLKALGAAALLASVASGIRALQSFVPRLTLTQLVGDPFWGGLLDAFAQAFLASLVLTLPGTLGAPDLTTGLSLALGAVIGAVNAGLKAIQGAMTPGERPLPQRGIQPPPGAGPSAPPAEPPVRPPR